jgi:hypothetical protein
LTGGPPINLLAGIIKPGCLPRPTFTGMKWKTANINMRVEPRFVEKIDAWRARQRVPPSRTAAIVYMIEQFLEHDGARRPWPQVALRPSVKSLFEAAFNSGGQLPPCDANDAVRPSERELAQ